MKLKDYLETLDENERIYLSSRSSFFFIGTKQEIDMFPEIETRYYVGFKKQLESTKRSLIELNKKLKDYKAELEMLEKTPEGQKKKDHQERIDGLVGMINEETKNAQTKEDIIKKLQYAIKHFKPFMDRKILDIYQKRTMIDEMGVAIKIQGYESGKYWTYKEWLEDHQERRKNANTNNQNSRIASIRAKSSK